MKKYLGALAAAVAGLIFLGSCGSPSEVAQQNAKNAEQLFTNISVPYKGGYVDCLVYAVGSTGPLMSCDWEGYHMKTSAP